MQEHSLTYQVYDVTRSSSSISRICDKQHVVVFHRDGWTGLRTSTVNHVDVECCGLVMVGVVVRVYVCVSVCLCVRVCAASHGTHNMADVQRDFHFLVQSLTAVRPTSPLRAPTPSACSPVNPRANRFSSSRKVSSVVPRSTTCPTS